MIRKIIRPKKDSLTIKIPREYIGKKIEYIIFPIENHDENKGNEFNIDTLGGSLRKYADQHKRDLEEKAWEFHVKDKFTR